MKLKREKQIRLIRGVPGHWKNLLKNEKKFIFLFLLKIEIEIWNPFFDFIMKTKNEKRSKFDFILKRESNVPLDPRIICIYLAIVDFIFRYKCFYKKAKKILAWERIEELFCLTQFKHDFFKPMNDFKNVTIHLD